MMICAFMLLTCLDGETEALAETRLSIDRETAAAIRERAETGSATAQTGLGYMYANGLGVGENLAEAIKWYRRAAEQNDPEAQVFLGVMYATGDGVRQDLVESHVWLSLAARHLRPGDTRDLARRGRAVIEGRLSAAQLADSRRRVALWHEVHAAGVPAN